MQRFLRPWVFAGVALGLCSCQTTGSPGLVGLRKSGAVVAADAPKDASGWQKFLAWRRAKLADPRYRAAVLASVGAFQSHMAMVERNRLLGANNYGNGYPASEINLTGPYKFGNTAIAADGIYTRSGNTVYGPSGTYTLVGNTIYGPNGNYTAIGNRLYKTN